MNIIDSIKKLKRKNNHVIVYDIDDTLIDSEGKIIPNVVESYFYAKKSGLKPLIVTARAGTPQNMLLTKRQLDGHGITSEKIYFRPNHVVDIATFKWKARKHIEKIYRKKIAISVGDMLWDIHPDAGKGFLVEKG